ncbi:hypothetical protein [Synechococcus sp. MIT S9504]|uniref:hypothetical protein n=1 Tax=Synechococcus sp. MIT S9504 TaxID=1801628 RepID=UPI0007BC80A2|nr:hypothetical protein [Synechococcus sp. MIT S9504]KZR85071.1 hypothetical protein MITS9504_02506 [Synechococcus sp. MIT S9504]
MLCVEQFCLRVLWELDQLEEDWMGCMATGDPEAVAHSYRMLGHHLQITADQLIPMMVISDAEMAAVNTAEPS